MVDDSQRPPKKAIRIGWLEVLMIGVLAVLLVFILLPAIQRPSFSWAPPRTHCKNNLKQIGLALYNYYDDYGSFPPAFAADANGRPMHSWRVLILPYIEQRDLYTRYDIREPWNGPNNIKLQDEMPNAYRCVSFLNDVQKGTPEYQRLSRLSNYAAITGFDCTFDGSAVSTRDDFPDHEEKTLAVVEVRQHAVHWMSPVDVSPIEWLTDLRRSATEANANHHECVNALFADGSVKLVPHDLDEKTVAALATRSGDEDVSVDFTK